VDALLLRFFRAARGAGVRISPAESLDAVNAVAAVGYNDRARLRDAMLLTIAKTEDEKRSLAECFDLFFSHTEDLRSEDGNTPSGQDSQSAEDSQPEQQGQSGQSSMNGGPRTEGDPDTPPQGGQQRSDLGELAQMLLANDRAAISAAMNRGADAAGLSEIRFFTQRGIYTNRILQNMGQAQLQRDLAALMAVSDPVAQRLMNARDALRENVREMVNRAILLYTREGTENLRNEILRSTSLNNLERRDIERTRVLVRNIARQLRDRYSKPRKKKNRGRLDTRKTIRRNAGWGGVPFITVWKQKRIDKPRIVALCDVSGSVARVVEFLLLFLYGLNEAVQDIRTFAFSGSLIEVSEMLDDNEIEEAMQAIMKQVGYGSSDYGQSLVDFEEGFMDSVTNRTTVIILGDGRTNNLDPRSDILRRISERAKRVIWLNPESRYSWGVGDSEMPRYEPYCTLARPCGTVKHLERVVSDILAMDRH
jgi:uncharacterized protein with von Willebrand factor type A (vWA) domain